jgi:hypothetical protein
MVAPSFFYLKNHFCEPSTPVGEGPFETISLEVDTLEGNVYGILPIDLSKQGTTKGKTDLATLTLTTVTLNQLTDYYYGPIQVTFAEAMKCFIETLNGLTTIHPPGVCYLDRSDEIIVSVMHQLIYNDELTFLDVALLILLERGLIKNANNDHSQCKIWLNYKDKPI